MATKSNVRAKVAALNASLDDLETLLEPLFAQSLPETLLGLETIQQAKLQTLIPYLLYDLIFIYLKTRGIDPRTHPVVAELERVKEYFEKISKAEKEPESRTTTIDKAAAGRFIKHAIAQARAAVSSPSEELTTPSTSTPTTVPPVKVTSKMVARAQYEKELNEQSEDNGDDGLMVYDDSEMESEEKMDEDEGDLSRNEETMLEEPVNRSEKSKGKQKANDNNHDAFAGNKRRRPAFDPFTGERISSSPEGAETTSVPQSSSPNKNTIKKLKTTPSISNGSPSDSSVGPVIHAKNPNDNKEDSVNKTAKKKKKAKKGKKVA